VGLISLRALPVFRTTIPSKFFDYLGAGLPVVVNYEGDLAHLVEDEGIGIAAGDNDPDALAQTLLRLRDDLALRTTMSARAMELARTRFNRSQQAKALEQVLQATVRSD
jgi:glycosyltransferase involved in cell wall biosynthesis